MPREHTPPACPAAESARKGPRPEEKNGLMCKKVCFIVHVHTRFPFGMWFGLQYRRCHKLKRRCTGGIPTRAYMALLCLVRCCCTAAAAVLVCAGDLYSEEKRGLLGMAHKPHAHTYILTQASTARGCHQGKTLECGCCSILLSWLLGCSNVKSLEDGVIHH